MILKQNYKRYIGLMLYIVLALLCSAIVLLNLGCGRSVTYSEQPAHPSANASDKTEDAPEFIEVLNDYRAERLAHDKKIDAKETEIRRYFRLIDKLEGQINGIQGEIDVIEAKARARLAEMGFSNDIVYTLIELVGGRRYEKAEIIGKEYLEHETISPKDIPRTIPELEALKQETTGGFRHE